MTLSRKPLLERAFELAGSGEYAGVREIRQRLSHEGYANVEGQLFGPELGKPLARLCREAHEPKE